MRNFSLKFATVNELELACSEKDFFNSATTLIQVFCASATREVVEELQCYFATHFPDAILLGTTTDGIILESDVYVDTFHVVTFTSFEHTKLESVLLQKRDNYSDSFELGRTVAQRLCKEDTKLLICFSDGTHTNGEEFANGLSSLAKDIPLSGGMAADNGKIIQTFIFNQNTISDSGVVAVALQSQRLHVTTNYTFDWLPIGKKMRITKAVKNRVFEIDGMSALDVYAKYLGKKIADQLPQIGIEFPLVMQRDGVLVGRAVIGKCDDGSLVFAGNIKEGTEVRFGVGNIEELLKNAHYSISKMVEDMRYAPEAIFIYSCMARRRFMDHYVANELKAVNSISPISGFFTYGEFFHAKNKNQLLNETMTIVALCENEKPLEVSLNQFFHQDKPLVSSTQHAIAKLANMVSDELVELNETLEKKVEENTKYIYRQAYYDKLTGLPNRLSLIKNLDKKIGEVLILVNIDDFTAINDFYGHHVGDQVLIYLSKLLQEHISQKDGEVFKLPSDEFAIILNLKYNFDSIEESLKKILELIEKEEFSIGDHYTRVSVTLSAAIINKEGSGLINADMALKNAKRGAKPYTIFQEDLQLAKEYEKNLKVANQIKTAIAYDKIYPFYQPIFSVETGKVEKYEALVRLEDDFGNILSPFFFLDISEKIKIYPTITEIMIEKTFAYFASNGLHFSINLAFTDMLNDKTRHFLFEKMMEYAIAPQLTIEILETQEYEKDEVVKQFIEDVYAHGAVVAIDDFGSGYANFEHLTSIHSDIVKIDGSLIKNIDKDKNAKLIVETIVDFVKKLDKKVIAEFVHSKEVYDIVKSLGVDYVQGYYLGEPKPQVL